MMAAVVVRVEVVGAAEVMIEAAEEMIEAEVVASGEEVGMVPRDEAYD